MIKAICGTGGAPTFESTVRGISIYLDTVAMKALAKGDASLRQRFVAALHNGADLLFSIANGIEISGAQGTSASEIKTFLDELGPHWYPVDFNPHVVMEREKAGLAPSECCFANELLRAYFANRTSGDLPGSGSVIDLSARFFQLGLFVDWLKPQRDHLLQQSRAFDDVLITMIGKLRVKHKGNPGWLNRFVPLPTFDPRMAATFAFNCIMRELICDFGFQPKKGDGMDLCHAVTASSFAVFGALDKHWKRRVENFPKPNRGTRIYYEAELALMVADIESELERQGKILKA